MSLNLLNNIINQAKKDIIHTKSVHELQLIYTKFLGKKGYISQQIKILNNLSSQERPQFGKSINCAKKCIHTLFVKQKNTLRLKKIEKNLIQQNILDSTLPGRMSKIGTLHPITNTIERIKKFFYTLGFSSINGPEIENDYFNFDALNIPKNHPTRNEQDTFWFDKHHLLRTHTSGMQIRAMINCKKIPIRIISCGRVYRKDHDKNHTPMFHQMEGFIVDTAINFSALKNILYNFLHYFFGENIILRFRPSYFPFTEPSAEIDIQMQQSTHWLEILGCGIIHPKVLDNVNINSKKFSGLAFGIGIERLTMLLHHINDIRILFENDLKFLNQFK